MKKAIVSCVLLLALAWSAAAADGLFETVVRASGGTQEAALANAIDEAIRKNLGALLSASEELAGDRLLFVDEGRIIESGVPREVFENPKEERTRSFLSKVL